MRHAGRTADEGEAEVDDADESEAFWSEEDKDMLRWKQAGVYDKRMLMFLLMDYRSRKKSGGTPQSPKRAALKREHARERAKAQADRRARIKRLSAELRARRQRPDPMDLPTGLKLLGAGTDAPARAGQRARPSTATARSSDPRAARSGRRRRPRSAQRRHRRAWDA